MKAVLLVAVLAVVLVVGMQPTASAAQGSVLVVRISSNVRIQLIPYAHRGPVRVESVNITRLQREQFQ